MRRLALICGTLALVTSVAGAQASAGVGVSAPPDESPTLTITTSEPLAQRYFDRGLRRYHALDREGAGEAFAAGLALDPGCAMCAWGVALALGPAVHAARDTAGEARAYRAIARAAARAPAVSAREQALIGALATRYAPIPGAVPRAILDSAYAAAMGAVAERFPDEPDVLLLHAHALVLLEPGRPTGRRARMIVRRLEAALARERGRGDACHLYLHAAAPGDLKRVLRCSANRPDLSRTLSFAASLAGRAATALAAARRGSGGLVHQTLVTFGRWDDALAEPLPATDDRVGRGLAYYARGVAFAARGRWAEARAAHDTVTAAAATASGPSGAVLALAARALSGEIALRQGRTADAVAEFAAAVVLEDSLGPGEPPVWYYPVRHSLGKALLAAGLPGQAERVYREDLARHRENGWSLFGLAQALEGQGKGEAAAELRGRFTRAWAPTEVMPTASRF